MIAAVRQRMEFPFREVMIDGDDRLEAEYGTRVPVVTVGGREAFEFSVDPAGLRALLDTPDRGD